MMADKMDGMDQYEDDAPPSKSDPGSVDDKADEQATDLLAKSSFPGGCKVGDKYEVEITGDHGDQFSVKVLGSDSEDSESSDSSSSTDSGNDPELDKMNSEYA